MKALCSYAPRGFKLPACLNDLTFLDPECKKQEQLGKMGEEGFCLLLSSGCGNIETEQKACAFWGRKSCAVESIGEGMS